MAAIRHLIVAALLGSAEVVFGDLADYVPTSIQTVLDGAKTVNQTVDGFDSSRVAPATLGQGKNDVGNGSNAWNCQTDTAAYVGSAWAVHNPNAGIGILKASHCSAVCQQDHYCVAFVYFGEGYPHPTTHNPAGIQPGSCWKHSRMPWPNTTVLPGFVTCWKPNVTKPSVTELSVVTPMPSFSLENVTVAPVSPITGDTTPEAALLGSQPVEAQTGGSSHGSLMWILGLAAIGIVGAMAAAFFCGACGEVKSAKKKKKTSKRSIKSTSVDQENGGESSSFVQEAQPFIPAALAPVAAPYSSYAFAETAVAPCPAQYVQTLQAQYDQFKVPAVASQVMMAPAAASQVVMAPVAHYVQTYR